MRGGGAGGAGGFATGKFDAFEGFLDGLGGDVVGFIMSELFLAAAGGFLHGGGHGGGDAVGVKDYMAVDVTGGTTDGLDEGVTGAEKAL